VSTLDKWILEKAGDKMYSTENKAVVLILVQTEDVGDNSMKAVPTDLKT
jgi:hypothetical protein